MLPQTVIAAYARQISEGTLTRAELLKKQAEALSDMEAGVRITSLSSEGASQSGTITCSPQDMVDILEKALQAIDDGETGQERNLLTFIRRDGYQTPA